MYICNNCISKRDPLPIHVDLYPKSFGPCELCGETAECIDHLGKLPKLKQDNNVTSVCEVRLSMKEILMDAVRRKATYSVQYDDYDLNTWTAPVDLTQNRMDKLLDDGSIRKVRLELEM